MQVFDLSLSDAVLSAQKALGGLSHYDQEHDREMVVRPKDQEVYAQAYHYTFSALDRLIAFDRTVREIAIIIHQVRHAQDMARQHPSFDTDFLLGFYYKDWVVRMNLLAELQLALVNEICCLQIPGSDLVREILKDKQVNADERLFLAIKNMMNYVRKKLLIHVKSASVKRTRNDVVHAGIFEHTLIKGLAMDLFSVEMGLNEQDAEEDIYIREGLASQHVKEEMIEITNDYLPLLVPVFDVLTGRFDTHFKKLMNR